MLIHATCVAIGGRAVLLCGPSGAGKSDLALRLIEGGARLVADDQVALAAEGGALVARSPPAIAGRMEVRGLGIVAMNHAASAPVVLAVDLVAPERVPRLPEPRRRRYLGIDLAVLALAPFEASAPAKVRLAVGQIAV